KQQFAGVARILFAYVGDGQQDAGKRRQQMALRGGELQLRDPAFLISWDTSYTQDPADWGSHRPDDVSADSAGQVRVIAGRVRSEKLRGPRGRFLGVVERCEIPFLDECCKVGMQSCSQCHSKQGVAIVRIP